MKALDILRFGIELMDMELERNPLSKNHIEKEIAEYKEAIAELEEMQKKLAIKDDALHAQFLTIGVLEGEIKALQSHKVCETCSYYNTEDKTCSKSKVNVYMRKDSQINFSSCSEHIARSYK